MKKSLKVLFSLIFIFILSHQGWGQQVIGSFPNQDGGFEGQTVGSLSTTSSSTSWWLSTSITGSIVSTGGRSGPKYANINMTGSSHRTLRGPAIETFLTSTAYVIQFYYKGDKNADGTNEYGDIRGGINGSTFNYGNYNTNQNTGSTWTKYTASVTPGASTSTGHSVVSIIEVASKIADFDIDDIVIYQGTSADVSAPNSPGTITISGATSSSLDVSWGGASGGYDGGGYIVVRYSTNPNADNDPNQNGIYAVGNTFTNGTGSLTGTVRYIGTGTSFTDNVGLSSGTTYYYKVYTVDKAFNYSTESSGNGTTTSSGSTPPTLTADATNNNVDNNIDITFTDDATWRAAITAVKIGGTALTVTTDYVISSGNIQLKPSGGNTLLKTSGSKSVTVEATGYSTASVTQQIDAGAKTKLGITTQPTAPASNGGFLAQQPVIAIQDQYGNTVTTATDLVMASVGAGTWTLGGTTSKTALSGVVTYLDLTATSLASVTGATISFSSSGLTGITSNTFNIPAPVELGWQITSTNSIFKIDFDNTVDGVNNGQFAGSGFQNSPSSGQLNSNAWAITGWSDGSLAFGGSNTTGDYARGLSTGKVSTGGIYAFTVSTSNNAFGFQPGSGDWVPGTATLRFKNKTGGDLTSLTISYKVWIMNDQGRSSSFNFSHSSDNSSYTDVSSLNLTSTATADVTPTWKMYVRTVYISGLNIANNGYYYLRWSGNDVGGSGSRDEFAIDDIQLVANTTSVYPSISGTAEEVVLDGNTDLSDNLSINSSLTLTSGILNTTDSYTLTLGENATNPTETETAYINGKVTIIKNVGTGSFHFIGCNMTAGDNIGILTLTRTSGPSGASNINNYNSIADNWNMTTTVSGSRSVALYWHSPQDNGNDFSTEKSAQLYNYVSGSWSKNGNGKVITGNTRQYSETISLSSTSTKYSVAVPSTITLYSQNFDTDNWIGTNTSQPDANWTNTPTTGNTSWRLNNQTASNNTASWSYPIAGKIKSYGNSGYSAQFHTYGSANASPGTFDLKLDFSTVGTKKLSFYYTNATGSDNLKIQFSTNNGVTFDAIPVETFTTGSWDKKTVTLGTSTEQNCIIRFLATSDFGRDDIGIDNVEVYVDRYSYTTDPGMYSINMNENYNTGSITPQATVKNYGSTTLSSFDVTMTIGVYSSTKTVTNLAANGTSLVSFDSWSPTAGTYTVSVSTSLSGDQNAANNTLTKSVGVSSGTWSDGNIIPAASYLGSAVGYTDGVNKYLYVTGGVGTETKFYKYTEATNTWSTLPDLPVGKTVHASAIVNGYLYVIGGANNGSYLSTVYRFNLSNESGNWETMQPLTKSIGWGKAAVHGNYIYLVGGYTRDGGAQALGTVYVYNTINNTWSVGTPLNESRKRFGGALSIVSDKLVYIAGASSGSTLTNEVLIGQITDPTTISWSVSSSPFPGNGNEIVIPSNIDLASLEFPKKNIKSGAEGDEPMSVYPAGSLYCLDAAPWGDNSIIVAGGTDGVDGNPVVPSLCYAFDLSNWAPKQSVPTPVYGSGLGTVYDGTNWYLLLASGYTTNGTTDKTQKFLVPLSGNPPRPSTVNLISGLEGGSATDNPPQTSVTVEIRNSTAPYSIVDAKTFIQNESGFGTAEFNIPDVSKSYYIVVRYANGLETWSAQPQFFINGVLNYDFTTSQSQAYGNNLVKVGGKWFIICGDIDQDGKINAMDRGICWNDRGTADVYSDLNGDGVVNELDRAILVKNKNLTVKKPEGAVTSTLKIGKKSFKSSNE